ncbi:hypothetical protein [Pseudomonas citri]|uniref:hypothetical protein n=1 Tax=Pseudomonas citri TaxID=2978349 RepID=UPI0036F3F92A
MDFPKSVPSVGLVDGKFLDEDEIAGTPGSLIPAQWGNSVTDELLNVIISAGLTPDENNDAQLLAAINAKIVGAIPASPPDASMTEKGLVELATNFETQTGIDALRAVTPAGLASRTATETRAGIVELATSVETQAGSDTVRAVHPAGLQNKISGVVSGQYPITPGAQAVFNHNLGVVPFLVEFNFVCIAAEGGWSVGDVVHRGNWYQNSSGTDISVGTYWYGETSTQVTLGLGSVVMLLPTKTNGFRFTATAANWRFTVRVIG